jgi:hypothetical protein
VVVVVAVVALGIDCEALILSYIFTLDVKKN